MREVRRKHSAAFRAKAALESMREEETVAEFPVGYEVHLE